MTPSTARSTARLLPSAGILFASALVLSACSGGSSSVSPTATTEPTSSGEEITIWLDEYEAPGLEGAAIDFEDDTGIIVNLIIKESTRSDFVAAPAAEAPDIILGAHDWLGELVSNGLLAPLELGDRAAGFIEGSVAAFNYDGQQFGLPYTQENVGLVCNTELMPAAPETFDEVVDAGLAIALANGSGDPYHMYPIQTSFGAFVFQQDASGSYTTELGMENDGGFRFAQWLWDNADIFDMANNADIVKEQMVAGEKACWITGPWNGAWFNENFGEDGWAVYPIPSAGGEPAIQFSGVRGIMLSANSKNPIAAAKFITEYAGSDQAQTELYEATGRIPSNLAALEVAKDSNIASGFGAVGATAQPMPAIPAMNAVWSYWGSTQMSIVRGSQLATGDPIEMWQRMCDDLKAAIGG